MSTGRILVVDDDPQIRRVMRVTLRAHGYEVDDATNGETALERLRERPADLVLLDMNMPGIGGLETCRAMRSGSEIAIIMLTARDSEATRCRRWTPVPMIM
jgi:two-component system KDP operon response regulator KdpE